MKKKKAILLGIGVLLCALFINVAISDHDSETTLTFSNTEALAQGEGSGGGDKVQCIESGYICFGLDANGNPGDHYGLRKNPDL